MPESHTLDTLIPAPQYNEEYQHTDEHFSRLHDEAENEYLVTQPGGTFLEFFTTYLRNHA